jgi:hypothetical protein
MSDTSETIGVMPDRTCTKCGSTKPQEDFYKKTPTLYRSECKDCHKAAMRPRSQAHYRANKVYYRERNRARTMAIVDYLREYKTGKLCADCRLPHPYWRLEFDHLRDKDAELSYVRALRWSFERIKREIDKCELVCANCHRDRTHRRGSGCSEVSYWRSLSRLNAPSWNCVKSMYWLV